MVNVKYAPNPQLVRSRDEYDELQRQLRDRVVTKPYQGCSVIKETEKPDSKGDPTPKRYASTVLAFTAAFNEQANADAPPDVRAAVARDSYALTGKTAANAILNDVTSHLTNDVAGRIGGQTGAMLQQAAGTRPSTAKSAAPAQSDDNAVTRGAKSLGGGIKRFFGGGKKPPSNSTTKGK
jgi:hypothetical protein